MNGAALGLQLQHLLTARFPALLFTVLKQPSVAGSTRPGFKSHARRMRGTEAHLQLVAWVPGQLM